MQITSANQALRAPNKTLLTPNRVQLTLRQNQLLAFLSRDVRARILPSMKQVQLQQGEVIHQTGSTDCFIYFPNDCLFSLQFVLECGKSTEIAVVGSDGIVGAAMLLGEGISWSQAVVQNAGTAYRISASVLRKVLYQDSELRRLLLLYIQAAMTQTAMMAVCSRHHSILQQLCFKLLLYLDRLNGDELTLTQDALANALGVRRESVTAAASMLREQGAIDYRRGIIRVLDRSQLEELSCECYSVLAAEYDRLLPW